MGALIIRLLAGLVEAYRLGWGLLGHPMNRHEASRLLATHSLGIGLAAGISWLFQLAWRTGQPAPPTPPARTSSAPQSIVE